jgi:hypothetical protein
MNQKQVVMDSVRKLLSLGISDREIIDNLRDVGIAETDARDILKEVKNTPASQAEIDEAIEESMEPQQAPEQPSTGKAASKKQPSAAAKPASTQNIEKLWEKGILATVDSKLEEMKDLNDSIKAVIAQEVQKETAKEMQKMKIVMESQRSLMVEKVNAELEKKAKEIQDTIVSQTKNLSKMNELSMDNINKLEALRKTNESLFAVIDEKLKELEKTKSRLVSEMNSELISSKSQVEEFITDAETKRAEIDARINRTLELESKITEGLLKDAEQKIENLSIEKSDELEQEVHKKITQLDEMIKQVNPEGIQRKLNELRLLEERLGEDSKKQVEQLFYSFMPKLEKNFKQKLGEIDGIVAKRTKELDALEKQVDVESINSTMEELEIFKKQFVDTVKKNVDEFNVAKKSITELMQQREKALDDAIKQIAAKIKEMNEFERKFAEEMGLLVEEAAEQQTEKSEKKKRK